MFHRKHILTTLVAGALSLGAAGALADTVNYDFSTVQGQYTGQAGGFSLNGATFSSPADAAISGALGGGAGMYTAGQNGGLYSTLPTAVLSSAGYASVASSLGASPALTINFAQTQNAISFNFAIGDAYGAGGQAFGGNGGDSLTLTTNTGQQVTVNPTAPTAAQIAAGFNYPEALFNLVGAPLFTSVTITASDNAGVEDLAIGNLSTNAVPLPGSLPLLLSGVVGVGALLRRRRPAIA